MNRRELMLLSVPLGAGLLNGATVIVDSGTNLSDNNRIKVVLFNGDVAVLSAIRPFVFGVRAGENKTKQEKEVVIGPFEKDIPATSYAIYANGIVVKAADLPVGALSKGGRITINVDCIGLTLTGETIIM